MRPFFCARSIRAWWGHCTTAAFARELEPRLTAIVLSPAEEIVECHSVVSQNPEAVLSPPLQPLEDLFQGMAVVEHRSRLPLLA